MTERFVVICPTWNRVHSLARALDSLLTQSFPYWTCFVLDDGSTDGTADLVRSYTGKDSRIRYVRFEENRGGVVMNEIGMELACEHGDFWTRLGSDDWFGVYKLDLDLLALRDHGACFGPYRNNPESYGGELNVPGDARAALLSGVFAVSWANIAVRSEVLRKVRGRHGRFCDPRLRNMEDYLFNTRLARMSEIVWRGMAAEGNRVAVGASCVTDVPFAYAPDAFYQIGWDGASNSPDLREACARDAIITEQILREDREANFSAADLPAPSSKIVEWPDEAVLRWYAAEERWGAESKDAGWAEWILSRNGDLFVSRDVLNLGCFYPTDEIRWATRARTWTAIDLSVDVIDRCRRMEVGSIATFMCMDMRDLEFADGSFDVVMDASSGDHLRRPDFERVLREAWRVLRAGGVFLVAFVNSDAMPPLFSSWRFSQEESGRFGYSRGYRLDEIRSLMVQAGFEVVQEANTHLPRTGFLARRKD